MCHGPEQEQNSKTTCHCTHKIHCTCGGHRVITKMNNEKSAHEYKQRSAGRMWDLQFVATRYEFTTIPETSGGFHSHDINCAGNRTYNPSDYIIGFTIGHTAL